jgi:Xaa-Pro aminopeptidase
LGRRLQPGFVITNEPGIYFIPELIDKWKKEKINSPFINYTKVDEYLNFGGIRIEDDLLITENGSRIIGKRVPVDPDEINQMVGS